MFNIQVKRLLLITYYLLLIFLLLLMTNGIDLIIDFPAGTDFNHLALESAIFALLFIALGWLLLKRLSLKEIAALRETLEKTVRQQASSIYKKRQDSVVAMLFQPGL